MEKKEITTTTLFSVIKCWDQMIRYTEYMANCKPDTGYMSTKEFFVANVDLTDAEIHAKYNRTEIVLKHKAQVQKINKLKFDLYDAQVDIECLQDEIDYQKSILNQQKIKNDN